MFKAYPRNGTNDMEFKKYHVLKVVPADAIQAAARNVGDHYKITTTGAKIEWAIIDDLKEMEFCLLVRNKRNLQQVAKEDVIPLQKWFQNLIVQDGYS